MNQQPTGTLLLAQSIDLRQEVAEKKNNIHHMHKEGRMEQLTCKREKKYNREIKLN